MTQGKFDHCQTAIPVRHKRKVPFSPSITSPGGFSPRALELRRLDGELDRYVLKASDYADMLVEAWAVNIHRSVSVEGNPLSLPEVKKLARDSLHNRQHEVMDWPRQEIVNHMAVHASPEQWQPPWTIEKVRALHRYLMEGGPSEDRPGELRDFRGAIENTAGEETMITAPPEYVEEELESLLRWRNEQADLLFPVVAASVFFHEFESIHPFANGNGRTGRVLFHIYLQTQGLPNSHLCLIEKELMEDLELYYRLLAWTDDKGTYTELVDFFTDAVLKSYREATRRLSKKNLLSSSMDELSKRLIVRAKHESSWFSVREAEKWIGGSTHQTVGRHLNVLIRLDVLESRGQTRNKRYRFKDPLRILKEGTGISLNLTGLNLPETSVSGAPAD